MSDTWAKKSPGRPMLRSMFRFSIRELFLLSVMVAVLIAWWLDSANKRRVLEDYRRTVTLRSMYQSRFARTRAELHRAQRTIDRLEGDNKTLMLRLGALSEASK